MAFNTIIKKHEKRAIRPHEGAFPATTGACTLLDKFAPQESVGKENVSTVSEQGASVGQKLGKGVRQIENAFRKCMKKAAREKNATFAHKALCLLRLRKPFDINESESYEFLISRGKKRGQPAYSAKDIENFTLFCLHGFEKSPFFPKIAGGFLSALVNLSNENDFTVHTDTLDREINSLFQKNQKNITIFGSVGDGAFAGMENGNVVLHGNAGKGFAASANGGTFLVHGNCGNDAGEHIGKGVELSVDGNVGHWAGKSNWGKITVGGSAGNFLGENMYGGSIDVAGDAGTEVGKDVGHGTILVGGKIASIGQPSSGPGCSREIYQNGVLMATGWNPFWQEFLAGDASRTIDVSMSDPRGQKWLKGMKESFELASRLFPGGIEEMKEVEKKILKGRKK